MLDTATDSLQPDAPLADLGPLAWVFEELRKSLDNANKAIKRYVRETEQSRSSDLEAVDPGSLRMARQQLHQAVGALEMVGLAPPAQVLRAMEAAVQRFVQRPEVCTPAAASTVERASFALIEYLEAVLNNKLVQPVALFAQYREVQELAAAERVHPADLWSFDQHGVDLPAATGVTELRCDAPMRSLFDRLVLLLVKTHSPASAQQLTKLCVGLSAGAAAPRASTFWRVAAGFFEAVSHQLLVPDVFVKRAASRTLLQFATFAQGQTQVSETLLRDLLFFCAQASGASAEKTPHLIAVRQAFGFNDTHAVDYHQATLGRYDPAVLVQARKRIQAAKEAWSLFSGGDSSRARQVQDQIGLIGDSLLKLHPASTVLARALVKAADVATHEAGGVSAELAMEVATTTLYLEAAFEDFDPNDEEMTLRTQALAERLEGVLSGAPAQPLDAWMEQLYRRVSDRQTMGSVVGELKVSLGEAEKSLDQFFRFPGEKAGLHVAVSQLAQMRGVLSVLGMDQAVQTVARMRATVDEILDTEVDEVQAREAGTFQHLGNNLSALSFLVDMLNYQPALAKKLFVFDEEKGELLPLMGRHDTPVSGGKPRQQDAEDISAGLQRLVEDAQGDTNLADLTEQLDHLANQASLADQTGVARAARDAAQAVASQDAEAGARALVDLSQASSPKTEEPHPVSLVSEDDEDDLLDIFLEEAREVVGNGLGAVTQLREQPADLESMTTLRRAFHTLKGSSRMVGLNEFGEAGWAMEQMLNAALAEQRPARSELLDLSQEAMQAFVRWVEDIAGQRDAGWSAAPFRASAEAWRNEARYLPLQPFPQAEPVPTPVSGEVPVEVDPAIDSTDAADKTTAESSVESRADVPDVDLDVDLPLPASDETPEINFAEAAAATQDEVPSEDLPSLGTDPLMADADAVEPPAATPLPAMLDDIDFGSLSALSAKALGTPAVDEEAAAEQLPEIADQTAASIFDDIPLDAPDASEPVNVAGDGVEPPTELPQLSDDIPVEASVPPESVEAPAEIEQAMAESPDEMADEQTKVIGPLRIGIKLYNVYLNEADEWSRRLCTELAEWALERHEAAPAQAESLAHSLAGSSAAVGFQPLSGIARALEHAIDTVRQHQRAGWVATPEVAQLFVDASEDIRRLLHQFAAGFLKEPNPDLLAALHLVVHEPLPESQADAGAESADGLDIEISTQWGDAAASPASEPTRTLPDFEPSAFAEPATVFAGLPAGEGGVRGPVQDIDDDIDALDTIDVDLFPIFAEEAQELLPQLGGALRQWVARPDNASARAEVLRNLHTLKGSARLAGALRLGEMTHRMETTVERMGSDVQRGADLEPVQTAFDAIEARFELLRQTSPETRDVVQTAPEQVAPTADAPSVGDAEPATASPVAPAPVESATGLQGLTLPAQPVLAPSRAGAAVRVRPELLDRLVNQAGEVMISRTRMESELVTLRGSLKELTGNLDRLRQQLRDMELQAETQMQSRLAQARDAEQSFDPLEFDRFTRVQEITRMMAESVNDVATVQRNLQRAVEATEDSLVAQGRQTRELQRDLLRTRMVEFEGISERLYRVVRQASKETGKQVRLDITGGNIEMDRGVLDRMTAAFEHLLRNCVVHGIERPEDRLAAGKSSEGRIDIRLSQELNDVSVVFSDDGAGLDLGRIRERAASLGLATDTASLNDDEAAQLIFTPGLSTASETSSLAGRGIGMDVVRADVVALGGRIETQSQPGQGTRFKLMLPLTTAVTQVVMVRAGALAFGVPSTLVEVVRRVTPEELARAYESGSLPVAGEAVPFYWAGALLQSSPTSREHAGRTLPVVIFRSAAQRVAMHVDEVLGNQEVVVKNLGPQLSRLPGLAGMSVLASGAVALIYNPVALATVYGAQVPAWVKEQRQTEVLEADGDVAAALAISAVPQVLVVDDSITVRRVTQRLLVREGYRVTLAADGLQALEKLQQERPTVVLSDIEMPRMDGFDLVRNIRSDPRLSDLPVIMITSRIAEKHREHARALGVDHYLGKPYSEDELLGLIAHYARVAAEA
ncbi:Hpt domain-containing protein [Hydrogenophaga sp.]|uniref:Hpt domain-containing protein n=1 Tax=Hydrogenophaga sp. TaxID=1904254 RepID=UPI0025B7CD58|nr:Hpt domain-containing protein [Hydrogenophaga sp.]